MLIEILQNAYAYQAIIAALISLSITLFVYSIELKKDLSVLKNEIKAHQTITTDEIGVFAYRSQRLMKKTNRAFLISVSAGLICVLVIIVHMSTNTSVALK